jgi:hypothetical protein
MLGWPATSVVGWWVGALVGQKEEGFVGGLVSWRGAWRIHGFTGGTLDGEMVRGALGLQLLATTVSSSSSSSVRMWNGLVLRVWC